MLSLFNKYLHGYVVTPCYLALKKQGIFQFLESPHSLQELVNDFKANSGHLRVALRIFESLNWLTKDKFEKFKITENLPIHENIPDQIQFLYKNPLELSRNAFNQFFSQLDLAQWLPWVEARWHVANEKLTSFFDSAVILPLLYCVKHLFNTEKDKIDLANIPPSIQSDFVRLLVATGIGQSEDHYLRFSSLGKIIWENIGNAGMVLSYRPMFSQMQKLIFNDAEQVFYSTENEFHVNRELNVLGSGKQHQIFFTDFQQYLQLYINNLLPHNRPNAIVDMGCGDGSLLQNCHQSVQQKMDVLMIGVDFNQTALEITSCKLKNLPHKVIKGDIVDPEKLHMDLQDLGINDKDKILHIRSFLDHDRSYLLPTDTSALEYRKNLSYSGIYVDQKGELLSNAEVIQSLVEHFKKWSKIIGKQGLITLEVFCLPPEVISRYLDETESLHFDACHGFSKQLLVEADVYLLCAAESGLFTSKQAFKKYPATLPYTRITRQHFFKRPYIIRHPNLNDLSVLIEIEKETMPIGLRSSEEQLLFRLQEYPQGQYVMEMDGEIVGMLYTQRIENTNQLYEMKYENMENYHKPSGQIVQLLGVYIALKHQGIGLSNELLEFGLMHNFSRSGVKKICGISRCLNYSKNSSLPLEKYITMRNSLGHVQDPILRMHDQMGAEIVSLVPNFRNKDIDNHGAGVHIEYTFNKWQRKT